MLTQKDEEIALLKQTNDKLNAENTVLKEEKVKLSQSVSDLTSQKKELDQKVELASKLRAENFKLAAVTKSNKERVTKSKTQTEFKAKDLDRLKVAFNIADNKVAPMGTKTLFLRVIEPEGSALYDLSSGSGTFPLDGVDVYYTAKQDILFDNKKPQVEFLYKKGTDYKKGKHTIEIYCEGALIGSSQFIVK
jgi:seryl-tRNA synthetase